MATLSPIPLMKPRAVAPAAREVRHPVVTGTVVAAGRRFGAGKRGSGRLARQIGTVLAGPDIPSFAPPADTVHARSSADVERRGTPIGAHDFLIVASALAADAILVTHDPRDFRRDAGADIEDWLA